MSDLDRLTCGTCGAPVQAKLSRTEPTPQNPHGRVTLTPVCTSLICETNMATAPEQVPLRSAR